MFIAFGWALSDLGKAIAVDVALTYVTDCYRDVSISSPLQRSPPHALVLTILALLDRWNSHHRRGIHKKRHFHHYHVCRYTMDQQSRPSKLFHKCSRPGVLLSANTNSATDMGKFTEDDINAI